MILSLIHIWQNDLAWEVRAYLKNHPCAAVVNLGCGLDNTGRACDNGRCKIYNLDFPDVIALRQQLLPAGEREQNISCDLKDPAWFDKIDASGGAVFLDVYKRQSTHLVQGTFCVRKPWDTKNDNLEFNGGMFL